MDFAAIFEQLTGNKPFPWQRALYQRFAKGDIPGSCSLPTGLGKTSIIAIWLIALASGAKVPRRLVYVVNRRTVVDQTTDEVEEYCKKLKAIPELDTALRRLYTDSHGSNEEPPPLAISTLRGQFADNRNWSENPARPAVICGTVDMIGSRLLFSGYGVGGKARPLHAGFLGQDVLLVHDEAHLEPAFQRLIEAIEVEQDRCKEFGNFKVMELTATSRGVGETFALTEKDQQNKVVSQRVNAAKRLFLHSVADAKKFDKELIEKAKSFKDSGKAVLVFAYKVETVMAEHQALKNDKLEVRTLTGTMRGRERDGLVMDPIFQRFLPNPPASDYDGKTVYLVCTSAGEVGVNISADHLICDLSTFESMAQRLGRVNRFGRFPDCEVHVYYPATWDKEMLAEPRQKTLELLKPLEGKDVSPQALAEIPAEDRQAAFAPAPTILPVTDILFDAWALTTIRGMLPGRPVVEPYLHGIGDWQPPETQVAWREEVNLLKSADLRTIYEPRDVLDAYPLLPCELLKEPSHRAFKTINEIAGRCPGDNVWLIHEDGSIEVLTLHELVEDGDKTRIEGKTLLLDPKSGGLSEGMLNGKSEHADDASQTTDRKRTWDNADEPKGMTCFYSIDIHPEDDDEESTDRKMWYFWSVPHEGGLVSMEPVLWKDHVRDVEDQTAKILNKLEIDPNIKKAIQLAAKYHDHGKRRKLFQRVLGNFQYRGDGKDTDANTLAKSGKKKTNKIEEKYRHEFGSLLDLQKEMPTEFSQFDTDMQDLVLHLIATHHGRARPHFPLEEVFDPGHSQEEAETLAMSIPRRFARLQRKYGRWGLAYLESLLRAGDWAASANPTKMKVKS